MNKNQEIYEILHRELQEGRYPSGSVFPSEYLLADRFQAGRCTVNKAVSMLIQEGWLARGVRGSGTRVLSGKKEYKPHRIAYIGDWIHNHGARVLAGIQQAASARSYAVEVNAPPPSLLDRTLEYCLSSGVEGIITMQYGILPKDYPLPIIYIDEARPHYDPDVCMVATRNYEASAEMMKALLKAGHREIAIYSNQDYRSSHRGFRVRGMMDVLKKAGIPRAEERFFTGLEYEPYDASEMLKKLYRKFPETTVVATVSDDLALGVILAFRLYTPPVIPMVTGFGNIHNITDAYNIPSVDQHPQHIGARACDLLIDILEKKRPGTPFIEYVDAEPINLSALSHKSTFFTHS